MDTAGNWARIKAHRERLSGPELRGLAEVLFYAQEDWLAEKLRRKEDVSLALEFLGFLGQGGSRDAAEILLKQLETGEEIVQAAVADALKRCPPELVLGPLVRLMRRQNQSAVKAGEALAAFGSEGADALWRLWFGASCPAESRRRESHGHESRRRESCFAESGSAGLKAQVLQLLAGMGDERAEALAFLAFLSGEDELVRAALKAAERLQAKGLWGNVVCCLKSASWRLRGKAAQLLGQWKESRALSHLLDMGADADSWVEEERQRALAALVL